MKVMKIFILFFLVLLITSQATLAGNTIEQPIIVHFQSGDLTLGGELYLPKGKGPFPAILFNHGSAPKMLNSIAAKVVGPMFTERGWVFFMPYRRGQGLSETEGSYIMDEINSARGKGFDNAAKTMVRLIKTDHLDDQIAALAWLKKQDFVQVNRIATMGNSFGGIQVVLGMANCSYCAGINAAGGSQSWKHSKELQLLMKSSAANSNKPIFFFQAENDYDLSPSKVLSSVMEKAGKVYKLKIYPAFGKSEKEGHRFPYKGASIWFDDVYSFLNKYCR